MFLTPPSPQVLVLFIYFSLLDFSSVQLPKLSKSIVTTREKSNKHTFLSFFVLSFILAAAALYNNATKLGYKM